MPLYTISTRGELSAEAKAKAAMMITDVHCAHTGAPRTFVQVVFSEHLPLQDDMDLHVLASARAGRTQQLNDTIEQDIVQGMEHISSIPSLKIGYELFPVPASWVMEGGVILPEPGEEAEWLEKHQHSA
ncbi:hypothetical protein [Pseudoteredinibacter isoporae]|uniref:Phenylpyruvate tautomerase PptA (4-oxalocrotonate tautomerase family) n=1 Tax=Pseudoteredinibacter isoporae TaxID=570281 RepID=A0A7X0MW79_9GAMM|nr:hypothetical protein [Pseudoteredinibacter isoporae]MBB6520639.1 phenylpyruvate tautomerase PptA (4-oxalocrotonate tautomerase family) [Pseudoteredinibacter isoporae]NHO86206.1 hypothetical protein [Pseudoteredinibacter isoporae]NIB25343.1 hypothetical protein [Pseudoteredinibacter isoporae]